MVKGINAQVIENPSMTSNLGRQAVQAGEVVVTSIIAAGDLELSFGDEEDDMRLWQNQELRQLLLPERTKEKRQNCIMSIG
ncbi:hypothetical protein L3X38_004152 [Prunus dulcis]|uniref:Uncharacterized protein n=1 Tax=Prunus dulcis TaxID=3755 RepID=A0AAD4ZNG5_PRUDU|nr:hypothetical protein L3X38_004152 [Prunus dulcis]